MTAEKGSDAPKPAGQKKHSARDARRRATERTILEAARRLVERDGVLRGLNLQEVAEEAGVNRALIYQYFQSRQGLLRAALADLSWESADIFHGGRELPFTQRRQRVFDEAIVHRAFLKLETLVALDGGEIDPFPALDATLEDLRRDQRDGALPADIDGVAAHALTAATYLGYTAYREAFAARLGVGPEELDGRMRKIFALMVAGIASAAANEEDAELENP